MLVGFLERKQESLLAQGSKNPNPKKSSKLGLLIRWDKTQIC